MREIDIGSLPVCAGKQLLGMVTDRDITVRAVADSRNPLLTKVSEVMTADVAHVYEDQDVNEAASLMTERQIRRLVVLDREGSLAGILSLGDIAVETGDAKLSGAVLEQISAPDPSRAPAGAGRPG
ncbi:MAG: CBS domain-containing protein [Chloroflexota bacterium]